VLTRRSDTIPRHKSGKARIATGIVSLQTSYRLDDRNHAGGAKDSDKQEVALHSRQTTTKRSQRGERGQLPHPWVHLQDTFHFALIWRRPDPPAEARRAGTCHLPLVVGQAQMTK
jgi:hypothetical protein